MNYHVHSGFGPHDNYNEHINYQEHSGFLPHVIFGNNFDKINFFLFSKLNNEEIFKYKKKSKIIKNVTIN